MAEQYQKTLIMKVCDVAKNFNNYMRKEEEKMGFSCAYRVILFNLKKYNGLAQVEIAQKTFLKAPTISITLQKMEQEELITRKADEVDLRSMRVYITPKGEDMLQKMHEIATSLDERTLAHLTKEELVVANTLIDKILGAILQEVSENENI